MPYRSNDSRSYQFADGHTPVSVGNTGSASSGAKQRTRRRMLYSYESRCTTEAKRRRNCGWRGRSSQPKRPCTLSPCTPRLNPVAVASCEVFHSSSPKERKSTPHRSVSCAKRKSASSRSAVQTSTRSAGVTSIVACACETPTLSILSPKRARRRSASCSGVGWLMESAIDDRVGAADLLLQLQNPVNQRFGGRRATRHVHIHRHDAVAAAHHRIRIVVIAAAIRAGAHRNDPLRIRHLVVHLAQGRRHLVDQRAGHDHHVGLARRGTE